MVDDLPPHCIGTNKKLMHLDFWYNLGLVGTSLDQKQKPKPICQACTRNSITKVGRKAKMFETLLCRWHIPGWINHDRHKDFQLPEWITLDTAADSPRKNFHFGLYQNYHVSSKRKDTNLAPSLSTWPTHTFHETVWDLRWCNPLSFCWNVLMELIHMPDANNSEPCCKYMCVHHQSPTLLCVIQYQ